MVYALISAQYPVAVAVLAIRRSLVKDQGYLTAKANQNYVMIGPKGTQEVNVVYRHEGADSDVSATCRLQRLPC